MIFRGNPEKKKPPDMRLDKCAHDIDLFIPGKVLLVHLTLGQILQVDVCIFQDLCGIAKLPVHRIWPNEPEEIHLSSRSLRPSNSRVSTRLKHGQSVETLAFFFFGLVCAGAGTGLELQTFHQCVLEFIPLVHFTFQKSTLFRTGLEIDHIYGSECIWW